MEALKVNNLKIEQKLVVIQPIIKKKKKKKKRNTLNQ